jgi:hypothetical protein
VRVEEPRQQRHERNEEKVGEGDARQRDGEIELHRILGKAGREPPHDPRHGEEGGREQADLHGEHEREHPVGEEPRRFRSARLVHPRIGWDEGGVEGALAEDSPEVIGKPQGNDERVRDHARAHESGHDHVAEEAGDARDERPAADRENLFQHRPACSEPASVTTSPLSWPGLSRPSR